MVPPDFGCRARPSLACGASFARTTGGDRVALAKARGFPRGPGHLEPAHAIIYE
jgi:hypothetical protein